jgi:hypothetical protein
VLQDSAGINDLKTLIAYGGTIFAIGVAWATLQKTVKSAGSKIGTLVDDFKDHKNEVSTNIREVRETLVRFETILTGPRGDNGLVGDLTNVKEEVGRLSRDIAIIKGK